MAWAATQQGKFEKARSFYLQAVQALAIVLAWSDVLKVLWNLGRQNDAVALHQALWVMIRIQAPLEDSLTLLRFTLKQEGHDPRLPALLVATALYLARTRDQNHAKLEQFRQIAGVMLLEILPEEKRSQKGIQEWLSLPDHHDLRVFLPLLNALLEELIGDSWYFDRSPLLERGFS